MLYNYHKEMDKLYTDIKAEEDKKKKEEADKDKKEGGEQEFLEGGSYIEMERFQDDDFIRYAWKF